MNQNHSILAYIRGQRSDLVEVEPAFTRGFLAVQGLV
jgi:hypothetical protein